jgi:hypothetical protein
MATDMRKASPETISDLKKMNFTVYEIGKSGSFNLIEKERRLIIYFVLEIEIQQNFISFRANLVLMKPKFFKEFYLKNIEDLTKKAAFLVKELTYERVNAKRGLNPKRLKENFMTKTQGIGTKKNNFLFAFMDEILQKLNSGGIPQHLQKFHTELNLIKRRRMVPLIVEEKKSFSIDDLHYGFVIWFISSAISCLAFMCELIVQFSIYSWKKFRKYVVLLFVLNFLRKYVKKIR